jgi:class 3 adenylate cyclase
VTGVFALFNSNQPYRALAAAITFKTFACSEFTPRIRKKTKQDVGSYLGIDQKMVLVRKLGLKRHADRTDRRNEVWAGKPVNMAAKLASISEDNQLLVSDRFFKHI